MAFMIAYKLVHSFFHLVRGPPEYIEISLEHTQFTNVAVCCLIPEQATVKNWVKKLGAKIHGRNSGEKFEEQFNKNLDAQEGSHKIYNDSNNSLLILGVQNGDFD